MTSVVLEPLPQQGLLQKLAISRASYVPPLNFSLVEDGIYRSGFPMPKNRRFLQQLNLKTIIYIGDLGAEKPKKKEKYQDDNTEKRKLEDKDSGKKKDGQASLEDTTVEHDTATKESKAKKDKYGTIEILEDHLLWIACTDIKFHHLVIQSSQEPFTLNTQEEAQASYVEALNLMLDKRNFPMLIHSNKGKHRVGVLVGLMRKIFQGWCMSGIFEEYEKFAMGKSEYDLEFIELWQPELVYDDCNLPDFVRL